MLHSPTINTLAFAQCGSYLASTSTMRQPREAYDWEYMCDSLMRDMRIMADDMMARRLEWVQQRLERQQNVQPATTVEAVFPSATSEQ